MKGEGLRAGGEAAGAPKPRLGKVQEGLRLS